VCTLNRRTILEKALLTAIKQTWLPQQIIVVDASTDWEESKAYILSSLATQTPTIQWHYINSSRRSLAYQRNIGFELCNSDIVFFFDDDSFMYPTCAEEIMQIYKQDRTGKIGGVAAGLSETVPELLVTEKTANFEPALTVGNCFSLNGLLARFHKLWYVLAISSEQNTYERADPRRYRCLRH